MSFAGNVTYKNAYDLRAAARRVPDDRLLAETDSPYLAPAGGARASATSRRTSCTRSHVLAEARGVEPAELERQIDANAAQVFGL